MSDISLEERKKDWSLGKCGGYLDCRVHNTQTVEPTILVPHISVRIFPVYSLEDYDSNDSVEVRALSVPIRVLESRTWEHIATYRV